MPLDPLLMEVLVCPIDKGPLLWFEDEALLYNPRLRRAYAVRDGIPVMLVDESTEVDDTEHARLQAKAAAERAPLTGPPGRTDQSGPSAPTGSDGQEGQSSRGGPEGQSGSEAPSRGGRP